MLVEFGDKPMSSSQRMNDGMQLREYGLSLLHELLNGGLDLGDMVGRVHALTYSVHDIRSGHATRADMCGQYVPTIRRI